MRYYQDNRKDRELGRIVFPSGASPPAPEAVRVTFQHAFSAAMGGGEYDRTRSSGAGIRLRA